MNKVLSGYSLMVAMLLGAFSAPVAASVSAATDLVLNNPYKAVFLFKTTGKDPYFQLYRPGTRSLETVMFGYYTGTGVHVNRVTKAIDQLGMLIPIRATWLFEDGPVKIDEKFVGWRESVIAKSYEDIFKATKILPDHKYKGTPFVDQYLEGIPSMWVLRSAAEVTSLRRYIEPMFEQAKLLEKGIEKPLLVVEIEGTQTSFTQDDAVFLDKYFTLVDMTNQAVQSFFVKHQEQINLAVLKIGTAKQVKEGFADMIFRSVESVTNEFKAKEMGAAIITAAITAVVFKTGEKILGELTTHAHGEVKKHAKEKVIHPLFGKDEEVPKSDGFEEAIKALEKAKEDKEKRALEKAKEDKKKRALEEGADVRRSGPKKNSHDVRDGLLIGAGIMGAVVVGSALYSGSTD